MRSWPSSCAGRVAIQQQRPLRQPQPQRGRPDLTVLHGDHRRQPGPVRPRQPEQHPGAGAADGQPHHVRVADQAQVPHEELAQAALQPLEVLLAAAHRRQPAHLLPGQVDHVRCQVSQYLDKSLLAHRF
jgi:hypothetical protein